MALRLWIAFLYLPLTKDGDQVLLDRLDRRVPLLTKSRRVSISVTICSNGIARCRRAFFCLLVLTLSLDSLQILIQRRIKVQTLGRGVSIYVFLRSQVYRQADINRCKRLICFILVNLREFANLLAAGATHFVSYSF